MNTPIPPTIKQIKIEWPILFSQKAIYWHFNNLTCSDIHLLDTFKKKEKKILVIANKKNIDISSLDGMSVKERLLHIVSTYFKETFQCIVLKVCHLIYLLFYFLL